MGCFPVTTLKWRWAMQLFLFCIPLFFFVPEGWRAILAYLLILCLCEYFYFESEINKISPFSNVNGCSMLFVFQKVRPQELLTSKNDNPSLSWNTFFLVPNTHEGDCFLRVTPSTGPFYVELLPPYRHYHCPKWNMHWAVSYLSYLASHPWVRTHTHTLNYWKWYSSYMKLLTTSLMYQR